MGYKYIDDMTQDRKDSIANVARIEFFRFLKEDERVGEKLKYEKFLLQNPIRMNSLVESVFKNLNSNSIAPNTDYELDRLVIGKDSADIIWNKYPEQMTMVYKSVYSINASAALEDMKIILSGEETLNSEDIYNFVMFNIRICEVVINALIALSTNLDEIRDCVDITRNCVGERRTQIEILEKTIPLKIISILDTTGKAQIVVDHIHNNVMDMMVEDYENYKKRKAFNDDSQ